MMFLRLLNLVVALVTLCVVFTVSPSSAAIVSAESIDFAAIVVPSSDEPDCVVLEYVQGGDPFRTDGTLKVHADLVEKLQSKSPTTDSTDHWLLLTTKTWKTLKAVAILLGVFLVLVATLRVVIWLVVKLSWLCLVYVFGPNCVAQVTFHLWTHRALVLGSHAILKSIILLVLGWVIHNLIRRRREHLQVGPYEHRLPTQSTKLFDRGLEWIARALDLTRKFLSRPTLSDHRGREILGLLFYFLCFIFALKASGCFFRVGFVSVEYRYSFINPQNNMTACEWQAHFHQMDAKYPSYNFSTFADSTHIPQCPTKHHATDFGNKAYETVTRAMERVWLSTEGAFFSNPSTHNVVPVFFSFLEHRNGMEDRWEHRVALLATQYLFRQAIESNAFSLNISFVLVVVVAYLTSLLMALLGIIIAVKRIVIPLYIAVREWLRPTLTSPRFELWAKGLGLLYLLALCASFDWFENLAQTASLEEECQVWTLVGMPVVAFLLWYSFLEEHKRQLERRERQEQERLERERQERLQREREEWERFQWEQAQQQRRQWEAEQRRQSEEYWQQYFAQREQKELKRLEERAQHLETLGLDSSATQKQIKMAFHKLAKQWHPDKNTTGDHTHTERMQAINAARAFLCKERD